MEIVAHYYNARRIVYIGMDAVVGSIIDLTEIRHAEREIARLNRPDFPGGSNF